MYGPPPLASPPQRSVPRSRMSASVSADVDDESSDATRATSSEWTTTGERMRMN